MSTAADPTQELRAAVERLSPKTREAMLEAVRCPATRIIAGGYVGDGGGVCPLLAAHRRGGRAHDESSVASPFASAWDEFTRSTSGEPREIGVGERGMLETILVASLARERRRQAAADLARAKAARRAETRVERERAVRAAVGQLRRGLDSRLLEGLRERALESDRGPELKERANWAWLGVHRRYDDYRAALAKARAREREARQMATGKRSGLELANA